MRRRWQAFRDGRTREADQAWQLFSLLAWARQHCITRGARAGGGTRELKQRATADLLGFLAAHDFASPWTNRKFPAIEES